MHDQAELQVGLLGHEGADGRQRVGGGQELLGGPCGFRIGVAIALGT